MKRKKPRKYKRRKNGNIIERRGREGSGFYGDFEVRGKRYRPFLGRELRAAKLNLGRVRAEKARALDPSSFSVFGEEFLKVYSIPNKRSWKSDQGSIKALSRFFQGTLQEITAREVEAFKEKRRAEVSPASVNRELACLKTLLKKAVEWGKLERSPASSVRKFREPDGRTRTLSEAEEARLLAVSPRHLRELVLFLLQTATRRGEALKLKWEDVDLDLGTIHIGNTKNGRTRDLGINETLRLVLYSLKIKNGGELVFGGLKEVKRSFGTACRRAGIKGLRLHDLRHTALSRLGKEVDLFTLMEIAGHSDPKMARRYCHPEKDRKKRAMALLSSEESKRYAAELLNPPEPTSETTSPLLTSQSPLIDYARGLTTNQ